MRFFPLLALVATSHAAEPGVSWTSSSPSFEPVLGGSLVGGNGRTGGTAFGLLPLNGLRGWGPEVRDRVLFVEPVLGVNEDGRSNASLGLGFRRLFADPTGGRTRLAHDIDLLGEGWYVGGNVFTDWTRGAHNQDHWQLGTGMETGSRYLTLHANWYWPLTGAQRWGEFTSVQETESGTLKNYELSVGPVVTSGPAAGTHDIHVTTTAYDSFRAKLATYGLYDEALRGWDTELSILVPGIDKHVDLRVIGGLYGFDGGSTGRGFHGWQVGAEFRPVPAMVLMATHFSDDRFGEGQWLAGVRFEIPLGTGMADSLRMRRRDLSERLMEPALRRQTPAVATASRREKAMERTWVHNRPTTLEELNLATVPKPGDLIQLQDGTVLVVEADGKTLRPPRKGERFWDVGHFGGVIIVPEPSRALLLLLGLIGLMLRRRRR